MGGKADRLRDARIKAGYDTARAAAEAMGINHGTYVHHENGTRDYRDHQAQRYARKFRVTPSYLLYGYIEAPKALAEQPVTAAPQPPLAVVSVRALHLVIAALAQTGTIQVHDTREFCALITDLCSYIDQNNITESGAVASLLQFAMRRQKYAENENWTPKNT